MVGKTRRWSRKSKVVRPVARVNEFGRVADSFFFPIASGFRPEVADRLLGADFMLFGRLITTLGTFVECSGTSLITRVLAKGVMELITPSATRFHPQAYVRRCIQYTLIVTIAGTGEEIFADDHGDKIAWMIEWLRGVASEDADRKRPCVSSVFSFFSIALSCLFLLSFHSVFVIFFSYCLPHTLSLLCPFFVTSLIPIFPVSL